MLRACSLHADGQLAHVALVQPAGLLPLCLQSGKVGRQRLYLVLHGC